jgi:ABC-type nitrate/sulfonate/bicarbonate transport system substrate-binding protein
MGVEVLSRPETTDAASLAGRTVGTFRADPMEVLLHDVLATAGLGMNDVELRYFDVLDEAIDAWRSGELAALTLAEPYATRLRDEGARTLSDGTELWGNPFPDTVLVASAKFLRERPDQVRAALRAMLRAEGMIKADPVGVLTHAREFYPGFAVAELAAAARRQPARVDIRALEPIVLGRWESLRSLDLVPRDAERPTGAIAFTLLTAELSGTEPVLPPIPSPKENR